MTDLVADLLAFVDRSPTPYHAVAESVRRLAANGFTRLLESELWQLGAGDRWGRARVYVQFEQEIDIRRIRFYTQEVEVTAARGSGIQVDPDPIGIRSVGRPCR